MFKKIYRSFLILFVVSILFLISGGLFKNIFSPVYSGEVTLKGLKKAVQVTRDQYGIPHIEAGSQADAFRALGYAMASDRLFQMTMAKRMITGRLAEVVGEKALKSDQLYRTLALDQTADQIIAAQKKNKTFNEDMWQNLEAYFQGVNEYSKTQKKPLELYLLGIEPEAFEPRDAYMMSGYMAFGFAIALKADPLLTEIAKKISAEQLTYFRNEIPTTHAPELISGTTTTTEVSAVNQKYLNLQWSSLQFFDYEGASFLGAFEGSNSWLIAPSNTVLKKSIFANDPHIGYSNPAVWYEAHLKAPNFEIYGHFLSLIPFPVLGHNQKLAWGFTMSETDEMDLYQEKLNEQTQTSEFKQAQVPYKVEPVKIAIKGQAPYEFQRKVTLHGPILDEVLEVKNIALKWAFNHEDNDVMLALHRMMTAQNMSQFEEALKIIRAPGLNVMYADPENIAWWMAGDVAVKMNENSDFILDGTSGNDEYHRLLEWNEKPHLVNPPSGFIVTANSRPTGLPTSIRGDFQPSQRLDTILSELQKEKTWDVEKTKKLIVKNYNQAASSIINTLLLQLDETTANRSEVKIAQDKLKNWNQLSEVNSNEALLYHSWNHLLVQKIIQVLPPELSEAYLKSQHAWMFYNKVLQNPTGFMKLENFKKIVSESFVEAIQFSKNKVWGDFHTLEFKHPLGQAGYPLNKIFNVGPFPMPGAHNEINNNKMKTMADLDFSVVAGPSTRRVIDFSNPELSWGINPIGNSANLFSPFHHDQVKMFVNGELRPQLMNAAEIQKNKTFELTLKMAP